MFFKRCDAFKFTFCGLILGILGHLFACMTGVWRRKIHALASVRARILTAVVPNRGILADPVSDAASEMRAIDVLHQCCSRAANLEWSAIRRAGDEQSREFPH
jgi:hypothetical protein